MSGSSDKDRRKDEEQQMTLLFWAACLTSYITFIYVLGHSINLTAPIERKRRDTDR
jgi:hypothetical protein